MNVGIHRQDALGARAGLTLLCLVYAAVALQMAAIQAAGGLEVVPFLVFGACQYAPVLLTLLRVPAWRTRLADLLQTWPGAWSLAVAYLIAGATLGLCTLVPSVSGHGAAEFAQIVDRYRLRAFVPNAFRDPGHFAAFIILVAPALHLANALGEEIFWRGYLLDWLEAHLTPLRAWAADGLLWGFWHAPMIALLDWDFPGQPAAGVVAIATSQIFWSLVLCRMTRRARSLWPATVTHATANAMTFGLFDTLADHRWNLIYSPWGLLGGAIMAALSLPILRGTEPVPGARERRQ